MKSRKLIALLMSVLMCVSLAACSTSVKTIPPISNPSEYFDGDQGDSEQYPDLNTTPASSNLHYNVIRPEDYPDPEASFQLYAIGTDSWVCDDPDGLGEMPSPMLGLYDDWTGVTYYALTFILYSTEEISGVFIVDKKTGAELPYERHFSEGDGGGNRDYDTNVFTEYSVEVLVTLDPYTIDDIYVDLRLRTDDIPEDTFVRLDVTGTAEDIKSTVDDFEETEILKIGEDYYHIKWRRSGDDDFGVYRGLEYFCLTRPLSYQIGDIGFTLENSSIVDKRKTKLASIPDGTELVIKEQRNHGLTNETRLYLTVKDATIFTGDYRDLDDAFDEIRVILPAHDIYLTF